MVAMSEPNENPSAHWLLDGDDDPEKIILGLDTSRVPVRMLVTVVSQGHGRDAIYPDGHVAFDSLESFCLHWKLNSYLSYAPIAVPADKADPLGIRAWLAALGQPLEEYEWTSYRTHMRSDMTMANLDLGDYERPYVLALYASYRRHAASAVRGLWARLFELHYLLEEIRHEAHRLTGALAGTEPPPWDEIPF